MIKLTIANSHKPVYINPDWIMYMRESSRPGETFIALGAQGATVIVEEALADIEMCLQLEKEIKGILYD